MGHIAGSKVWTRYKSFTVQIDLQALARNLRSIDLLEMLSVSLGRASESMPSEISPAGNKSVNNHPSYLAATLAVNDAYTTAMQQHGSVKAAHAATDVFGMIIYSVIILLRDALPLV